MKILLINPPQRFYNNSLGFNVYFPLSLLYVAGMIRKYSNASNLKIYDSLVDGFEIKKDIDSILYGSFDKLSKMVSSFEPDVVGITVPFSSQVENTIETARICKEINPNTKVFVGGNHPSVRHKEMLNHDSIDYVVVGEGELTFNEAVDKLSKGKSIKNVEGLASKSGYIKRDWIQDLDIIPFPAYELINVDKYLSHPYLYKSRSFISENSISMITSRGCPYHCIFCSIGLHMGHQYRFHSPNYVYNHIRHCIDKLGITNFHFEDDNFSLNKMRFNKILDLIIDNKLNIRWDTPNGVRADTLSYEVLKKIKKSGCISLRVAVESGNQDVLNNIINKQSDLNQIKRVANWCKKLNIKLTGFYVIGFPGETIGTISDTVNFAIKMFKDYNMYPILLFATPLYGTRLFDICMEQGIIDGCFTDKDIATAIQFFGEPMIETDEFRKNDLKNFAKQFESEMNDLLKTVDMRNILKDQTCFFDDS